MSHDRVRELILGHRNILAACAAMAWVLMGTPGWAQQGCAADRPCFTAAYQKCHSVIFEFNGVTGWDFYNVRHKTSNGEQQVENKSGTYTINNARPNSTYSISVQGCNSRALASSRCSAWVRESVTTVGSFGPDTCRQGYVWREASPADHVCVDPKVRSQAAADNAQARARRRPGGGASGPDTCIDGYVWREAFPGDHVCVTPNVRTQVQGQNQHASRGRLCY
jgi:hypothetical protein